MIPVPANTRVWLAAGVTDKPLAIDENDVSYKDLLYTRRRYLHSDSLRQATRTVANATMQARLPHIWGEGSTRCASDSIHLHISFSTHCQIQVN